ncbi:MAG TPA: SRPBCC domain-containing protein [Nitrososphaerales archaeon]|nr:SRPBCC domain-containing protein [Nitrososphaerales archaeon]
MPDLPENYHVVTITLFDGGEHARVCVTQTKNASEAEHKHDEWGWRMILQYLKKLVEK